MKSKRETFKQDGRTFLDRWGFECRWGGVYLHHIPTPDPGRDLHDHPWTFKSLVLKGSYGEWITDKHGNFTRRHRARWSFQGIRLDQAHRISYVAPATWTLVFRGPRVRRWGFHTNRGWVDAEQYER